MNIQLFILGTIFLFLLGCRDVVTSDGRVPPQLLKQAQQLSGTYRGVFNGTPTTLLIRFQGDRPEIHVLNSQNNDLLGPHCQSRVGSLIRISGERTGKGQHLASSTFAFDGNACPIQGSELTLEWNEAHTEFRALLAHQSKFAFVCITNPSRCGSEDELSPSAGRFISTSTVIR